MRIEREMFGEIEVLTVKGKMLIGEGDELLRDTITSCLDNGVKRVLLDLGDCPYVDSAGLSEIVRSYTALSRKNGTVALLNLSARIRDLLSITKLLTVFPVFTSKEKALQALKDGTW